MMQITLKVMVGVVLTVWAGSSVAQEFDWWRGFQEETRTPSREQAPEPEVTPLRGVTIENMGAPSREAEPVREVLPSRGIEDIRQTPLPDAGVQQPDRFWGFRDTFAFDQLVSECAAIESQFGRACDAERMKELLATSIAFEGDAARVSDALPDNADVVTVANAVLKGETSADLKAYAWTLLFEEATFFKGEMHQIMKDSKTMRMTNFTKALKDSMALMKAQELFRKTGKTTPGAGESATDADAAAKKYMSGDSGQTHFGAMDKDLFPGASCYKAIKWQLPKAGGGFGPGIGSMSGDVPPEMGGGTPTSPDDKPNTAKKLEGLKPDCTALDPTKIKQVSQGNDSTNNQGKPASGGVGSKDNQGQTTTGKALASGTAEASQKKDETLASGGNYSVAGTVTEKKTATGEVKYEFKGTVTNEDNGKEHNVSRDITNKNGDGPAKFFKATDHSSGIVFDIKLDKMYGQVGSLDGKQPKGNTKYLTDPNAEVDPSVAQKDCKNAVNQAFNNCLFGALMKEFEKNQDEEYCKEQGFVAGEDGPEGGTYKVGGLGKKKPNCNLSNKPGEQDLDKEKIFMKSGGGWTDPTYQMPADQKAGMPGQEGKPNF